jgi:hypothetical protein
MHVKSIHVNVIQYTIPNIGLKTILFIIYKILFSICSKINVIRLEMLNINSLSFRYKCVYRYCFRLPYRRLFVLYACGAKGARFLQHNLILISLHSRFYCNFSVSSYHNCCLKNEFN